MPSPSVANDFFQTCVLRIPTKNFSCLLAGCNQSCRVAGSSRGFNCRNRMTGDGSCSFDNFPNRIADAVTQIEDIAFAAILEITNRQNVSLCQVGYMDVVPNASAVWCIIVCTKDGDCIPLAVWNLQNQRNQVAFRIVCFTDCASLICTASVEIPERNIPQTMCFAVQ